MNRERFARSPLGGLVEISGVDGRFGTRYRHVAYVPHPLGPEPELSATTWHAVTAANRALARLDQASRQVPNPGLLRQPALRREAQSTSALEGTFTALEQVLGADPNGTLGQSTELREVLNYVDAANGAFAALARHGVIRGSDLEAAHGTLVRGTGADTDNAGRVRRVQVAIGSVTGAIEDSRFVPMPPGLLLDAAYADLISWLRAEPETDPVVAAAMAHYQFETIHPFNDGNGRIGRLLIVLQLMARGIIREPLLTVSPWFEARRERYQDMLASVSSDGHWEAWIGFFANGVAASAIDVAHRVDRLLAVQNAYTEILRRAGTTGLAREIVSILIGTPVLSAATVRAAFGRSSQASINALRKLVTLGILTAPSDRYNRKYVAPDVMMALAASVGMVPAQDDPLLPPA